MTPRRRRRLGPLESVEAAPKKNGEKTVKQIDGVISLPPERRCHLISSTREDEETGMGLGGVERGSGVVRRKGRGGEVGKEREGRQREGRERGGDSVREHG